MDIPLRFFPIRDVGALRPKFNSFEHEALGLGQAQIKIDSDI